MEIDSNFCQGVVEIVPPACLVEIVSKRCPGVLEIVPKPCQGVLEIVPKT